MLLVPAALLLLTVRAFFLCPATGAEIERRNSMWQASHRIAPEVAI